MNPYNNSCSNAIRSITQGNVVDWYGLPQPCYLIDLSTHFPQRLGEGFANIGLTKTTFYMMDIEGVQHPLRVWVEKDIVVVVDTKAFELSVNLLSILSILGEPERKLDAYIGTQIVENGEWVYLARGLALFLHPKSQRLDHISLFPSTDISTYEAKYRLHLQIRRFPNRR